MAGEPAAPSTTHAVSDPLEAEAATALPDDARTQDREERDDVQEEAETAHPEEVALPESAIALDAPPEVESPLEEPVPHAATEPSAESGPPSMVLEPAEPGAPTTDPAHGETSSGRPEPALAAFAAEAETLVESAEPVEAPPTLAAFEPSEESAAVEEEIAPETETFVEAVEPEHAPVSFERPPVETAEIASVEPENASPAVVDSIETDEPALAALEAAAPGPVDPAAAFIETAPDATASEPEQIEFAADEAALSEPDHAEAQAQEEVDQPTASVVDAMTNDPPPFVEASPALEAAAPVFIEAPAAFDAALHVTASEPKPIEFTADEAVETHSEPAPFDAAAQEVNQPTASVAEAVTTSQPEPIEFAAEEDVETHPAPAHFEAPAQEDIDQPAESAVEAMPPDPTLFIEAPPEGEAPADEALFPATSARDEAVLFSPGVESAPDVVAEIIPYAPPIEAPPSEMEAEARQDMAEAARIAVRAPEDLATSHVAEQQSALGAAFSWLAAHTSAALFGLRARLPRGKEKAEAPKGPIPSRRRTHWPSTQRAPDSNPSTFRPSIRKIAIMSGWAAVLITASIAGFFIYLTRDMPSTRSLWTADNSPSLTFVDRRGRVIIREGAENAPPVDLKRLPPYVSQAIIAIEDRRFYEHFGIDVSGLMRAAASNMKAGHVVQGGSTITQQLAKNLFLNNNRTFQRKVQEVALALWLESQFSKRDILALYMSRVYFGAGAYGIEAAAERYFDKPAKDLTLAESALLAGLVKAPSKLNPAAQETAAKARAKIVLDEMLNAGFITPAQHKAALNAPMKQISRNSPNGNLGYFRDWIDPQLNQVLGDQRDDFIIETTLDLDAQRAAEATLDVVIERERKIRNVSQGAVLAMDSTGGVTTMVGGLNYGKGEGQSEFNRTTQSLRAPGSSFKYFIYMAAMAKGMTPWDIYVDKPVVYGDWAPGNYEDKYYGPVTLASAYAKSLNMVAIQLANDVSGAAVIATAQSLGVGKRLQDYRSLGLGAQGMTVMEMVTGYGAMAASGYPIEPHGIERVRRANGQVLWARRPATPPRQVIDDRTMRMMNYLGTGVVRAGTGTRAQIPGREIAGKTGTSNDYRDAWFIGYVPGMVAGVWLGNDNNTAMTKVTGGLLAAEVWHDFMVVALRDTPIQQLAMPEVEEAPLPAVSGEITETPPASLVTVPPLAPEAPPPLAVTPVGGDG